ncbi:hypothetical protein [Lysinibacillus fusiformis]|uniref:hypothetical protein n=1 Tax=Lysinibacillus fusiformis TaxID=28031 RepID=UPI003807DA6A
MIEKIMVAVDLRETDVNNKTRVPMVMATRTKIFVFLLGFKKSSNMPRKKQNAINTRYS